MISIPKVGSQVLVTTKHKNVILGGDPYKYNQYRGTVIESAKWMNSYEFMLATNDPMRPKAIINASFVSGVEYLKGSGSVVNSSTRTFKVSSKSSGKDYIVTSSAGKIQCTCTGFEYRKYCKHSQAVSKIIAGEKHGN